MLIKFPLYLNENERKILVFEKAGILAGLGKEPLPTHIVSNEYLTLEKKKLSTSKNWAVWVPDMLEMYQPDSIRYFLTINAPENRDADFSWKEFIYSHNSEFFVNRTLKFIERLFDGVIPEKDITSNIHDKVNHLYNELGHCIENAALNKYWKKYLNLLDFRTNTLMNNNLGNK